MGFVSSTSQSLSGYLVHDLLRVVKVMEFVSSTSQSLSGSLAHGVPRVALEVMEFVSSTSQSLSGYFVQKNVPDLHLGGLKNEVWGYTSGMQI